MIKSFVKIFSVISKPSSKFIVNNFKTKNMNHFYSFCSSVKPTSGEILVKDNPDVKVSTQKIGNEELQMIKTEGSISIMDRIPGVKADNGQLYILSFTCTKCETKSIRSFTKHAYHKGVVLVRCGGCQNIHLVADNIGWFDDKPTNVETLHEGKVKRVIDPLLISQFLQKAFQDDKDAKQNSK